MTGQHTEIAFAPGYRDHVHLLREQKALWRDEVEGDLVGHLDYAASAAIFWALATASSIVPTM